MSTETETTLTGEITFEMCPKCNRTHLLPGTLAKTAKAKTKKVKTLPKNAVDLGGWVVEKVNPTILTEYDTHFIPEAGEYFLKKDEYMSTIGMGIAKNIPVLMIGPKGCGKSTIIREIASLLGMPYRRIPLTGMTGTFELLGHYTLVSQETRWVNGALIDAMERGHWVQIDEINAATPEVLFALHSLTDDDRMIVLSEHDSRIIKPHPRFRLFSSMNPTGGQYHGTKAMNAAFLDRFLCLTVGYPTKEEEIDIVSHRSKLEKGTIEQIVAVAHEVRKASDEGRIYCDLSTREIINWAKAAEYLGVTEAAKPVILGKLTSEADRGVVIDIITAHFTSNDGKCKETRERTYA